MATPNTLFAIMNVSDPDGLRSRLASIAPWVANEVQPGEWLLVAPNATTTKEVSERIGYMGPGKDTAIILKIESYFGRNHAPVWEWISAKLGAELGVTTTT